MSAFLVAKPHESVGREKKNVTLKYSSKMGNLASVFGYSNYEETVVDYDSDSSAEDLDDGHEISADSRQVSVSRRLRRARRRARRAARGVARRARRAARRGGRARASQASRRAPVSADHLGPIMPSGENRWYLEPADSMDWN